MGANVLFVECICPDTVLRKRLSKRQDKKSVSDARVQHLEAQRQTFEILSELDDSIHLQVSTDQSLQQSLEQISSAAYLLRNHQAQSS